MPLEGNVKEFYCDRGTNFVGSVRELGMHSVNVEDPPIHYLFMDKKTIRKFNTPHPIIHHTLKELKLTHEVLTTFLAEVMAIINNRPIVPISTDSE